MHFANHTGTHIDFPAHVIADGKRSIDFTIQDLIGPGIVIDCICLQQQPISIEFIAKFQIKVDDFVFFKNFTAVEEQAAIYLIRKQVKIVGVDSLSIDRSGNTKLPIHHLLLENNILIVEFLNLTKVNICRANFLIAPLKIDSDGASVRVLMWQIISIGYLVFSKYI